MKRHSTQRVIMLLLAALLAACCGCGKKAAQSPQPGETEPPAAASFPMPPMPEAPAIAAAALAQDARNAGYDAAEATHINFTPDRAEITGEGVSAAGGAITITRAGDYLITGETRSGQIIVDAGEADAVRLIFAGVSIRCGEGPALCVWQAGQVTLTAAENTENALFDGAGYSSAYDKANACVYSEARLTLNGAGTLNITGDYKHGISVKDAFAVADTALTVTAKDDGIKGRDGVTVLGAALTVTAGGDAISSSKAQGDMQGRVILEDSVCTLVAGSDGVQAETALYVTRTDVRITAGGGAEQVLEKGSAKGLKSGGELVITGGVLDISSAEDALHAGGGISFSEASATLASGDDAIHADGAVAVYSGTIGIPQSNEGIEGRCVDILGGTLEIRAANDGVNAAVSVDGETVETASGGADVYIRIAGGTVYINAAGDGVDSNGDLYFTGGTTLVCGPTDNQNGALDYDGAAKISGGVLVALGWPGEAKALDADSPQAALMASMPARAAGERLTLCDAAGKILASCVPEKAYASAVISAPGMGAGDTVTLFSGGNAEGEGRVVTGGTLQGGARLDAYTLSMRGSRP